MRTKVTYIVTLITDPTTTTEVAGKLEVVKNGESVNFSNWEELKTLIIGNLMEESNPTRSCKTKVHPLIDSTLS
jgi:hypothetical protein